MEVEIPGTTGNFFRDKCFARDTQVLVEGFHQNLSFPSLYSPINKHLLIILSRMTCG